MEKEDSDGKLNKINLIYTESKEIYKRNLENSSHIDNKLVQLFTFITALTVLFINTINFPDTAGLKIMYILTVLSFVIALIFLIYAYRPMSYQSIEPNELIKNYCNNKYETKVKLIEALAGTTSANLLSIKKNINSKTFILSICAYLAVFGLILIIILNIIGG